MLAAFMPVQPQTIDVPPLAVRADVGSINDEARTVELVFSTGAAVNRYDWMSGKQYLEKLSLKPEHVRIDRLNGGGPLLDAHSAYSITDQIGAVEPGSVKLMKGEARATVRFSRRDAVEAIWQDVRDKIIRAVSVGYRVFSFEEVAGKDGAIPTRTAIDWEPYEISLVPMPADTGARVRSHQIDMNPCVIRRRDLDQDSDRRRRLQLAQATRY